MKHGSISLQSAVGKARTDLPWQQKGDAPGGQEERHGIAKTKKRQSAQEKGVGTTRTAIVFTVSAIATLVAGVVLEASGDNITGQTGMSGVLFGSMFLAAATALPEISTGLASVKLDDYKLAVSDIFGGSAFLSVLFLLASLLSGQAALPQAQKTDIYLTGLGPADGYLPLRAHLPAPPAAFAYGRRFASGAHPVRDRARRVDCRNSRIVGQAIFS